MFRKDERKARALAALYRRTPTDELARRIAEGSLVPAAQEAAAAELDARLDHGVAPLPPPDPAQAGARGRVMLVAVLLAACMVVGWFVLPDGLALLLPVIALPAIAAPIGKQFPRIGVVLAVLFAVLPFALGVWGWQQGALRYEGGDFKPLGALIAWAVLIFMSLLSWAIAGSLVFGSRDRGSWSAFDRKLARIREEQAEGIGK
jgi:hypothetical protein